MRDDGVGVDLKVEAPVAVHACLPDIPRLVILLRAQRWMPKVAKEKPKLLPEVLLDSKTRSGAFLGSLSKRSVLRAFTSASECVADEGARRLVGLRHPACLHIRQRLIEPLVEFNLSVNELLRAQQDALLRGGCFEEVADLKADRFAGGLWDRDLKLRFDSCECHSLTVAL